MMDCMLGLDCGPWMMLVMGVFWLLLITLVVWGLYRLFAASRSGSTRDDFDSGREAPMDVLNRRYAAGEISEEEYDARKRKLNE